MQITDIHYGENFEKDVNTTNLMQKFINYVKPDFITLTGDALSGYAWDNTNQTFYQDNWKMWTSAFNKTKIPYGYTSGNHDTQANYNITQCIELDKTSDYAIARESYHPDYPKKLRETEKYPITESNFYVRVYHPENSLTPDKVAAIFWFMDSGVDICEDITVDTWGCVTRSQISWFEINNELLFAELGYLPENIISLHIPMPEVRLGLNFSDTYGHRGEPVNCPTKNTYFFDSIKHFGKTKLILAGHDHNNDFCSVYFDVELCYGRKTGYGGYGPENLQRGVRIINLELNEEKNTLNYENVILQEDLTYINSYKYNKSRKTEFYQSECEKV